MTNSKIFKVTEYDLLRTSITPGNYYACTDSRKIYVDTERKTRDLLKVTMIDTEAERIYSVKPMNGLLYYVWETNELWIYNSGWVLKIGQTRSRSSGYYYSQSGNINATDDPNSYNIIDNNGLLKDGSVVVRDSNRVIKGRLYINEENNNLIITSFLGGGIQLLPNGYMDALGSLVINPNFKYRYIDTSTGNEITEEEYLANQDNQNYEKIVETVQDGIARYNGEWNTTQDMYVNIPNPRDTSDTDIHHYKVWHEGNFQPSDLILSPEDILNELKKLDSPIDLDVDTVDGMHASEFALKSHKHNTSDITDLTNKISSQMHAAILGGNNKGISITYDSTKGKYNFSANSFSIVLSDGVSGNATVTNLGNINIPVTVDPSKHTHEYDLSDLTGYDDLIKLINSKLDEDEVSKTISPNKIPYLDNDGNLPTSITGNAKTANKLTSGRTIEISGGVIGSAVFDGSKDIDIVATVDPDAHKHTQYALVANIGQTIAPLDGGIVLEKYLPNSVKGCLQYQGEFYPSDGYPSELPIKGQYWVANSSGSISGVRFESKDWIVFNGTNWDKINNKEYIESINGQSGNNITISSDDVDAISKEYLPDDVSTIPSDKLVVTDSPGHVSVTSASSDKLTNKFSITVTDDSDIYIDPESSVSETDGTDDLVLNLKIKSGAGNLSFDVVRTINIDSSLNGLSLVEVG